MSSALVLFEPGQFDRVILLGSGLAGTAVADFTHKNGLALEVYIGPRQANTKLEDGTTLSSYLHLKGATVCTESRLRGLSDGPYETATDGALILSLGSPYIIPLALIDLYQGRVINSHAAPLPEWRGGGGFSWRILAGDRRGNSCLHLVTPGIDEGDIILQRRYEFPKEARLPRDYMKLAVEQDRNLITELLEMLKDGAPLLPEQQDETAATYFPRLSSDSQAFIDWSWHGAEIERFILAFSHPYSGAKTFLGDRRVHLMNCWFESSQRHQHPFLYGLIYARDDALVIACRGGTLFVPVECVVTKELPKVGDRLTTPGKFLAAALELRPTYTPDGMVQK